MARIILTVILLGAAVQSDGAQDSTASSREDQYGLQADVTGQYPPAGVDASGELWHRHVYHRDPSRLWDGLYVQGGVDWEFNPAYGGIGAYVEWQPVAILQLRAQLDRYAYFGTSGSLVIYPDRDGPFGSADSRQRHGREVSAQADRLLLQPTLQASMGPYVVVNQFTYTLYDFSRAGPYFWDQEYDTLLKKHDRLYCDDLSFLYQWTRGDKGGRLLIGPSVETVRASGAGLTRTRVGLSLYFAPAASRSDTGRWLRPRLYFQVGVNAHDRNQGGRAYVLGGVGAEVDFD